MNNYVKKITLLTLVVIVFIGFSGCEKIEESQLEVVDNGEQNKKLLSIFEEILKTNGDEIELETKNSDQWHVYLVQEKGFNFKYPIDWYVIPIDSSESVHRDRGEKKQEFIKDFQNSIKGQIQSYPFLCITDLKNYQNINNKNGFDDRSEDIGYCNIVIREYIPTLNDSKNTSGELWLNSYQRMEEVEFLKYIENEDVYVHTGSTVLDRFLFMNNNGVLIDLLDYNALSGTRFDPIIYNTIIYSIELEG